MSALLLLPDNNFYYYKYVLLVAAEMYNTVITVPVNLIQLCYKVQEDIALKTFFKVLYVMIA